MKGNLQIIVQHHRAVQPHTAISWLVRAPSRPQATHTARHCALKKQPTKADHLWLTVTVKFDSAFIKLCVCVKKSNFLSWVIRPVFVDPVTHTYIYIYHDHMKFQRRHWLHIGHIHPKPTGEYIYTHLGKVYISNPKQPSCKKRVQPSKRLW